MQDRVLGRLYEVALDPLRLDDLLDDWDRLMRPQRLARDAAAQADHAAPPPAGQVGTAPGRDGATGAAPAAPETTGSGQAARAEEDTAPGRGRPPAPREREARGAPAGRGASTEEDVPLSGSRGHTDTVRLPGPGTDPGTGMGTGTGTGAVPDAPGTCDFAAHFRRVTRLLEQTRAAQALPAEMAELRRFDRCAAFTLGPDLRISAANEACRATLGVTRGDALDQLPLDPAQQEPLRQALRALLDAAPDPLPDRPRGPAAAPPARTALRLRPADAGGRPLLAQLALRQPSGQAPFLLVVTTELRWPADMDETLRAGWGLTPTEAVILRMLAEARPLREIAEARRRSIETVRAQIKAIQAKTETRSQAELLRLALSLSDLSPPGTTRAAAPDEAPGDWVAPPAAGPGPAHGSPPGGGGDPVRAMRPANPPGDATGGSGTAAMEDAMDAERVGDTVVDRGRRGRAGMVRFSHGGGLLPMRPYKSLPRPAGRRMQYLDLGARDGAPVIWCHGTPGFCRWPAPLERAAAQVGLRVLVPIRPSYGNTDPARPGHDPVETALGDILAVLDRVGAQAPVPVASFGTDFHHACRLARLWPDRIGALVGVSAVLPPTPAPHFDEMGRWHRFMLAAARFTPDLAPWVLGLTRVMAQRMGQAAFLRTIFAKSPADSATLTRLENMAALRAASEITLDGLDMPLPAVRGEMIAAESRNTRAELAALLERDGQARPVYLLHGLQSLRVGPSMRGSYGRLFPGAQIRLFPEAGDLLHLQEGSTVIALLRRHAAT